MAQWLAEDILKVSGKIAIVDGANSNMGLETAAGPVQARATVIMARRDE